MTEPKFEALKARALAGEAIEPAEIAELTPAQSEAFAAFCREKAGWVLKEPPTARELYREKSEP